MPGFDDEFQKLLGAQNAGQQQALGAVSDLATLLTVFRGRLILGGIKPACATEMARDYFNAMLDAGLPDHSCGDES